MSYNLLQPLAIRGNSPETTDFNACNVGIALSLTRIDSPGIYLRLSNVAQFSRKSNEERQQEIVGKLCNEVLYRTFCQVF